MTIRTSLAWSFSQRFLQMAIQFVGSIFIARLLTPEEVGVFALAMAASTLISTLREFGVGTYLIREEKLDNAKIRTAFGAAILMSWTLGALLIASRGYFATLYDTPALAEVLLWISALFFIGPLGQPANALLIRRMRFKVLHHINFVCVAMGTLTSVSFAFLGYSYMSLAWGLLVNTILRAALQLYFYPTHLRMLPSLERWREVFSFGGLMVGVSTLGTLTSEGVKFVLAGFTTPGALALYERSNQIPSMARQTIFGPIARVLLPSLSDDFRKARPITRTIETVISGTTVIVWPAFANLGLLATPIIVLVFGENWRVAGELMPFVLATHALLTLLPQPDQILVPCGQLVRLLSVRAFLLVSTLTIVTIGASHSLELFAALLPLQGAISIAAIYLAIRPYWQCSLKRLAYNYLKASIIAAGSCAPTIAFVGFRPDSSDTGLIDIVLCLIFSAVSWLLLVFATRHPLANELHPSRFKRR